MADDQDPQSTYRVLRDRAHAFVRDNGGRVAEDDLIRFMFGASTKPGLWTTLLRTVIGSDHRFRETFGGTWSLAAETSPSAGIGIREFVALDVETTGLKPYQHRVIEIGLARYQNNRCVERFSALVNPERRLPDYIVKLTGLTDSDLIPAPRFSQIAHDVVGFIGNAPILGHNVGFDIGFVNAELDRLRMRKLENESIDTIPLAMQVLGRRLRPSLDRVSAAVGLGRSGRHRALADAELTAEVALRLWAMATDAGADPIEIAQASSRRGRAEFRPMGSNASHVLDRKLVDSLPRAPGVYLMVDADERILYVGKAKSIRDRVSSYYSQPLGYTRKMDGLIEQIHRIDHEETGSELLALLLEAQLIRRHMPPYNRMLTNSESYPFIRIDPANNWPTVRLARQRRPDGARYFGPYRSRAVAKDAVELLNRRFRLRSCGRGFRSPASYGNPCIELDLKRCDGPCVGRADPGNYRSNVRAVLTFLEGDGSELLGQISAEISIAVDDLRFEEAQRLRRVEDILVRIHAEQESLNAMNLGEPYLIVQAGRHPDEIQVLMVIEGRWWSLSRLERDGDLGALKCRLAESWERYQTQGMNAIDHSGVDEANIIARWRKLPMSESLVIGSKRPLDLDWDATVKEVAIAGFSVDPPLSSEPPDSQVSGVVAINNRNESSAHAD